MIGVILIINSKSLKLIIQLFLFLLLVNSYTVRKWTICLYYYTNKAAFNTHTLKILQLLKKNALDLIF